MARRSPSTNLSNSGASRIARFVVVWTPSIWQHRYPTAAESSDLNMSNLLCQIVGSLSIAVLIPGKLLSPELHLMAL